MEEIVSETQQMEQLGLAEMLEKSVLGEGNKSKLAMADTDDVNGILQSFFDRSQGKGSLFKNPLDTMLPQTSEDLSADPMRLVHINSARLTHANTISLVINNTAQVFSQRVSMSIIEALQQSRSEFFSMPLETLDKPLLEMMNLFNFGSIEAIGMMKGITDGTLRVLYQLTKQNPGVELNLGDELAEKLMKPWSFLIKRLGSDLQKACIGFLKAEGLNSFIDVRKYNNGELVPWLDGDTVNMVRSAEDEAAYKLNSLRYQQDQQRAIDTHLAQLQFSNQEAQFGSVPSMKRPFNVMQGFFMPEPKKKKNYSHRYYQAKNKQRNPNPKRICKSIWQDDGQTRGCGKNSHPRGVCACWKRRGFQKKDLRNGRILAWLQMAYPGRKFVM